jgi:hypothetical protein
MAFALHFHNCKPNVFLLQGRQQGVRLKFRHRIRNRRTGERSERGSFEAKVQVPLFVSHTVAVDLKVFITYLFIFFIFF